ncbi:MAG: phage major capsid protein [Actinomycetota bacterium]
MDIRELKQKRTKLGADARAILDGADGRDLTAEEEQEFDRLMAERDTVDKRIEREEKARAAEDRDRESAPREPSGSDDPPGGDEARMAAFRAYVTGGRAGLTEEQVRALNMGNDPEGGFLVAPQQFVQELIQEVDDMLPLRPLATTSTITQAESLGVPTLDTDLDDAEWTAEVATGSTDDSLRFGKRELRPHPLAKRVKVSRTLLRRGSLDPEAVVRERLSHKFGVTQERAFMTGDGNNKPLGLFTASSNGISTSRDVDIDIAAGALDGTDAADGLIDAKFTLKSQYWRRARWLFHRLLIGQIRKLKDADNRYIWQPGLALDRPDTILDVPYVVSEFAPSTVEDDAYIGMIGDFSFYWIVDALSMEIQRLVELYAESNQVGFIGRLETDAMPVLEEPFVRLQAAA